MRSPRPRATRARRVGEDARPGYRNGYRPVTIKTTAGRVEIAKPSFAGPPRAFASRLSGAGVTKSNALQSLVIAGVVRDTVGCETWRSPGRRSRCGGDPCPSRRSRRVGVAIKDEFATWSARRLDEVELGYLFLDASRFRMHSGARAEPVLVAWGSPPPQRRC